MRLVVAYFIRPMLLYVTVLWFSVLNNASGHQAPFSTEHGPTTNGSYSFTWPVRNVAVIGAGLTGVSSAAHAIAHGFDVVIYEKNDKVGTP